MKVYSYSEARQRLAALLDEAQNEEVLIKRKDGSQTQGILHRGRLVECPKLM